MTLLPSRAASPTWDADVPAAARELSIRVWAQAAMLGMIAMTTAT